MLSVFYLIIIYRRRPNGKMGKVISKKLWNILFMMNRTFTNYYALELDSRAAVSYNFTRLAGGVYAFYKRQRLL